MRAPWSAEPACCLHSSTSLAFDSVSQATGACPLDRGAKWDLKRKALARPGSWNVRECGGRLLHKVYPKSGGGRLRSRKARVSRDQLRPLVGQVSAPLNRPLRSRGRCSHATLSSHTLAQPGLPAYGRHHRPRQDWVGVVSAQALLEMQLLPGPCQGPAHIGLEG